MAIFLLQNAGASVTGTPVRLNGGIRNVHIQADSYGSSTGVILESRVDTSLVFVPLTRLGLTISITTNQSVIIPITSNGIELRAVTSTGCSNVTVAILPSGTAE